MRVSTGLVVPTARRMVCASLAASLFLAAPLFARQTVSVAGQTMQIRGDLGDFTISTKVRREAEGLEILTLSLSSKAAAAPPAFALEWSQPAHDIAGFWSVTTGFQKTVRASWSPSSVSSMLARSAPVFSLFGHDDQNRLTVAVSDALETIQMSSGLMEEDGRVYSKIRWFSERHKNLAQYKVEVRFDTRPHSFSTALQEVPAWWESFPGYEAASVPDIAKLPMYSTWYSYHQSVTADALLAEAKLARGLGYEAIIVDDGWQTLDSNRGYAYTGDWRPDRMPQMREFVDALHAMDMKILLWYAVPFMGEKAANFERFQGKYLRYWDGQGAYVLDPRYPEVREYIIDTYRRAIREWDLDGFKLDFIARFTADATTVLEKADGRDFASVNAATDRLMTDIMSELRKEKPDIMVEFRQPYVGPLMRKYGNIFRVGDCPNVAVRNRVGSVDLRLLSGDTAVHSDMIMWHYDEAVDVAALQFLNILFSVPQVSVRLEEIPESHLEMVQYLTGYWIENRGVLLDGELTVESPLSNYPSISARKGAKKIVAVYEDRVVDLAADPALQEIDLVNGKLSDDLVVRVKEDLGRFRMSSRNSTGNLGVEQAITLSKGVHSLPVPAAGILSLRRVE